MSSFLFMKTKAFKIHRRTKSLFKLGNSHLKPYLHLPTCILCTMLTTMANVSTL